jgi:SAM-dependent methyltransferase
LDFEEVAIGWARWSQVFERGAGAVSERIIERANIGLGHRVLDFGTGVGEPALGAARRVGATGTVIAIDPSPTMLDLGRERARRAGLENITFIDRDLASFAGGEPFDAIVSRWGLMFAPDLHETLERMRELLKPHGRVAASTWGLPQEVPLISLAMGVAAQLFDVPRRPLEGGPFALHDAELFGRALTEAGFADVTVEDFTAVFPFESPAQYWEHVTDVAPPVRALLARLAADQRTALRAAVDRAAEQFSHDGTLQIPNRVVIASASNPGPA